MKTRQYEKAIFLPSENFPPAQQLYLHRRLSFDQKVVEKCKV